MDWINKHQMIVEKMKNQIHSKGIDSLDKIYIIISNIDPYNTGYVEKINFENFLSKVGIFLKTQELSELHKFLYTNENGERILFENFINSLKCDVPNNIIQITEQIFSLLSGGRSSVSIDELKSRLVVEAHPRVKIMIRSSEEISNDFDYSLRFFAGEKGNLDVNDFVELHRNMYYVQPKENISNFFTMVKEIWGYNKLQNKNTF